MRLSSLFLGAIFGGCSTLFAVLVGTVLYTTALKLLPVSSPSFMVLYGGCIILVVLGTATGAFGGIARALKEAILFGVIILGVVAAVALIPFGAHGLGGFIRLLVGLPALGGMAAAIGYLGSRGVEAQPTVSVPGRGAVILAYVVVAASPLAAAGFLRWGDEIRLSEIHEMPAVDQIVTLFHAEIAYSGNQPREVIVHHPEFGDDDLGQLSSYPTIEILDISRTGISGSGVKHLQPLVKLRELNLSRTAVDDMGLSYLIPLRQLESLNLYNTCITDQGLASCAAFDHLSLLNLASTSTSDAGVVHLQHLPELAFLSLDKTSVSDRGIRELRRLPKLKSLSLLQCSRVTSEGVKRLQESLPDTDIAFSN